MKLPTPCPTAPTGLQGVLEVAEDTRLFARGLPREAGIVHVADEAPWSQGMQPAEGSGLLGK